MSGVKRARRRRSAGAPSCQINLLEPRQLFASLPSGFFETRIATGLSDVTAMTVAPDGRIFVSQQTGEIRVIKDGQLLADPFATLPAMANGELGLQSVAFDPNFATNHYLYAYYTGSDWVNHIARLTADGDSAVDGSATTIFSFSPLVAPYHVSGSMKFLPDGTMLVSHGDNFSYFVAQGMDSFLGKIMRINTDGSIPTDNPFYNTASGDYRAIWAIGLRNPYTIEIQPGTNRIFLNDVGQDSWEEINEGVAGSNYGWPVTEGHFDPEQYPDFKEPLYTYPHTGIGGAITGGAFYDPGVDTFGEEHVGHYFFSDFVNGWIKEMDFSGETPVITDFASNIQFPLYPTLAPDGGLYYLERGTGSVWEIQSTSTVEPMISNQPDDAHVSLGEPATFSVTAAGPDLTYQWQRDEVDIDGATDPTYTLASPIGDDDGAQFRCIVTNQYGSATSDSATLHVQVNALPEPTILTPIEGTTYIAGDTISFSGSAIDAEDGTLGDASLTWRVDFHHHTHTHPFMTDTSGISSGSFVIPTLGETDPDVWYRIYLTATDSNGASKTIYRDVTPITSQVTVVTNFSGLGFSLDGQPQSSPLTFTGVAGILRTLTAPATQVVDGQTYEFVGWSDSGDATHTISTPVDDTTYLATYREVTAPVILDHSSIWDLNSPTHALTVTFSEDIGNTLSIGAFSIFNRDNSQTIHPISYSYDPQTHVAVFAMAGILDDGNYTATLSAAGVTDASGNALESGLDFNFFIYAGDANHDRVVDVDDLYILATNWYQTGGTFSQGDFNGDGIVDGKDLGILSVRWQQSLADVPPSPPPAALATSVAKRATARAPARTAASSLLE